MEKGEEKVRRRERYGKIEKAILAILVTAGVLSIAAIAPNVFSIVPRKRKRHAAQDRQQVANAATRLAQKGLVTFKETDKGKYVRITKNQRLNL